MERASHTPGGSEQPASGPAAVAAHIPHGLFVMTAAYEDASAGTLVRWVQRCSDNPVVVMVSLRRGQPIEPLIRDSRTFALCQVSEDDRFLQRKFGSKCVSATEDECLISLSGRSAPSGSPILEHAMSFMECELLRNVDLETDYRLYVGQVHHAELLSPARPAMFYGERNGQH